MTQILQLSAADVGEAAGREAAGDETDLYQHTSFHYPKFTKSQKVPQIRKVNPPG